MRFEGLNIVFQNRVVPPAPMADKVAKMTHHPRSYAFFAKQGLSKEDTMLLPLALMGGCMVAQYPSAASRARRAMQAAETCGLIHPASGHGLTR